MKTIPMHAKPRPIAKAVWIIVFSCTTLFFHAGCTKTNSTVKRPQDIPVTWDISNGVEATLSTTVILDLLDNPILKALAQESLANNPDLIATNDRLSAQAALLGVSRAKLWPSIDLNIDKNRGKQQLDSKGSHTTSSHHYVGTALSWEIDVWGRLRDQYNSDNVSFEIQQLQYNAARDSLIVRTIQSWIRTVSLARSIDISKQQINNLGKIQGRILSRYRDGIGSVDGLSTANSRIFSAKAERSELVESHCQAIRELELLLGRYPANFLAPGKNYPELRLPTIFKPGEVLVHRLDVQVALNQVRVAELQQSAAEKSYLPSFLITGKFFKENVKLSNLLNGTALWDMIMSVSQPIFNAGRISNEIKARKWEQSAALQDLKKTVLSAVIEIKKYWGLEQMLSTKGILLESALQEATKSYEYFEKRYLGGLDPIVNMLNAKEEQITIQSQINELQAARLINRIDLALALGLGEDDEY